MGVNDVYGAFEQWCARAPERAALRLPSGVVSYGELRDTVNRIRRGLLGHALRGRPVGVWTGGGERATYAALLAVMAEGAAYVPLNARFPAERNRAVIAESGLEVVVSEGETEALVHLLEPFGGRVALVSPAGAGEVGPAVGPAVAPAVVPHDDELAYLLFTSGSTGRPKGVPIPHRALRHFLTTVTTDAAWGFGAEDVFLQMFELTFDLSVFSFFTPLVIGASCAPVPSEGVQYLEILRTLEDQGVTVALMVPSALAYLRPYFDEIELPALRQSLFCGEALPSDLALAWAARVPQARVENVYGPTEATIFCTRYAVGPQSEGESLHGVVPIGRPMPGVETVLLDESGQAGDSGELCLGGPQVTPGYWHNPSKNAEAFVEYQGRRYYRTGDRCGLSPQGNLLYLGRTDQQVKVDGYRVELGEIEHHARRLTGAHLAVVAAERAGHVTLHLYLEGWAGDAAELCAQLSEVLPSYMIPTGVHGVERLPLNANGKIDRPALRALAVAGA